VAFRPTITRGLALSAMLVLHCPIALVLSSNFNAKKNSIFKLIDFKRFIKDLKS
jgi:hypothetical protein